MGQAFDNGGMTPTTAISNTPHAPAAPTGFSPQQLVGRRDRLERELAHAFGTHPFPGALIERLVEEMAATEREIEALQRAIV